MTFRGPSPSLPALAARIIPPPAQAARALAPPRSTQSADGIDKLWEGVDGAGRCYGSVATQQARSAGGQAEPPVQHPIDVAPWPNEAALKLEGLISAMNEGARHLGLIPGRQRPVDRPDRIGSDRHAPRLVDDE